MSYHMEVDPKFYMAGEKRPEATNVGELNKSAPHSTTLFSE